MRVLVAQPNHESNLEQLREELKEKHDFFDTVLYPEGYVLGEESLVNLRGLAKHYEKNIITGYRDRNNKDRALIIDVSGDILLERAKSPIKTNNSQNGSMRPRRSL